MALSIHPSINVSKVKITHHFYINGVNRMLNGTETVNLFLTINCKGFPDNRNQKIEFDISKGLDPEAPFNGTTIVYDLEDHRILKPFDDDYSFREFDILKLEDSGEGILVGVLEHRNAEGLLTSEFTLVGRTQYLPPHIECLDVPAL